MRRAICLVLLLAATLRAQELDSPPMLPFDGIQWRQRVPFVRIGGDWYELLGAEGVPIGSVLAKLEEDGPRSWQNLFAQLFISDLVERGVKLGPTMLLELREPGTGERIRRHEAMTLDNFSTIIQMTEEEMFPDRVSPFDVLEWIDDRMRVEVGKHHGFLVSVNKIPVAELIAHCKKARGKKWRVAVVEELPHLITELRRRPRDNRVDLVLERDGARIVLAGVKMTYARRAWLRHRIAGEIVPRIGRQHSGKVAPGFEELAKHFAGNGYKARIPASEARADLAQLEWLLTMRHATHGRMDFDLRVAIDAIHSTIPKDGIPVATFALQVRVLLTHYGDAQTQVTGYLDYIQLQGAQHLLAPVGDRWFVFRTNLQDLDKKHPYVWSIDGVPMAKWVESAQRYVPKGTPALRAFATRWGLHSHGQLRQELGITPMPKVRFVLDGKDGKDGKTLGIQETDTIGAPITAYTLYGQEVEVLPGNIVHVPIRTMDGDDKLLAKLHEWAAMFRMTNGLILDLRQNGGGSHRPILEMLPYFLPAGSPPRVIAVGRERYAPGFEGRAKGPLSNEGFAPIGDRRWSERERAVLTEFRKKFQPAWKPAGPGSEWQYLLVSPSPKMTIDKPVVVLFDGGTMGSAEVAVAALKGLPNVTFIGSPTAGSHGPTADSKLHFTGIHLTLPVVTVYGPDGKLFTGNSIEPDVTVTMRMSDWLRKTDIGLETALRVIAEKTPR